MEKKVIVIDEVTKESFENAMNDALNKGFIPCGQPSVAFSNGAYRDVVRYVVTMIKLNEKITATLL